MKNTEKKNKTRKELIEELVNEELNNCYEQEFIKELTEFFTSEDYEKANELAEDVKELEDVLQFAVDFKIMLVAINSKTLSKSIQVNLLAGAKKDLTKRLEVFKLFIQNLEVTEEQVGCPDTSLKNKTTQNGCDVNGDSAVNETTNL